MDKLRPCIASIGTVDEGTTLGDDVNQTLGERIVSIVKFDFSPT